MDLQLPSFVTPEFLGWLAAISLVTFVVGLLALPILLVRIPENYFIENDEPLADWRDERPKLRLFVLVLRNVLGLVLVLLGIVMLVTPGQGIVTILVGISLMTFPGKHALELSLLRRKGVLKTINWIRRKRGRCDLKIPDAAD